MTDYRARYERFIICPHICQLRALFAYAATIPCCSKSTKGLVARMSACGGAEASDEVARLNPQL